MSLARPRLRRTRNIAALLLSLNLLLAACGSDAASPTLGGSAEPDTSDSPGGDTTITAAWTYLGTHDWSPAGSASDNEKVLGVMSNALIRLNKETLELEGELAESFTLSDDGTTWTFTLRPDIPFHGGYGTLTAEDVKYTWGEHISPASEHGALEQLAQAIDGNLDNFEIVSDLEFRLTTTNPIVHLPAVLCSCASGMAIHSKAYADEVDEETEANHPITTGPWQFVSSTSGVEVMLEAFDEYWEGRPAYDRLVLQEIPDEAARLVQVQSGAVDIAELAPRLTGEAEAAGLDVRSVPDVGNVFVILGGSYWGDLECCELDEDAPWIQADDLEAGKAIREALSLAIDRQLIFDTILRERGDLALGPLLQYNANPDLVDPSWTFPEYDPDLAREKLAEGGYPDGFPVEFFIYEGGETDLPSIAEAIAGMWEQELGLDITRTTADEDVLDAMLDEASTDGLAWVKLAGYSAEPALELGRYLERRGRDHKFLHPALEEGYEAIVAEPDRDVRFAETREMISALKDDTIVITLFTADMLFAAGPRIGDWDPIPGLNAFSGFDTITVLE